MEVKAPEVEVREGIEAEQLLRFSAFGRAFGELEQSIYAQLKSVGIKDVEAQTKLVLSLQLLGTIRQALETAVQTGKMAEMQLEKPGRLSRLFG